MPIAVVIVLWVARLRRRAARLAGRRRCRHASAANYFDLKNSGCGL
jgi:hypothetical protein